MTIELRAWTKTDAADLMAAASSSIDLASQFGDASFTTVAEAEAFIEKFLSANSPTQQNYAIVFSDKVVGNVGLSNIERRHDTAWVSYWLAREVRGQGLASRALASVASWAFNELGLFRLELGHRVNNPASCAVAVRAGFAPEGIERQKLRYGRDRFDVETHSRLATDSSPTVESLHMSRPVVPNN